MKHALPALQEGMFKLGLVCVGRAKGSHVGNINCAACIAIHINDASNRCVACIGVCENNVAHPQHV